LSGPVFHSPSFLKRKKHIMHATKILMNTYGIIELSN
jgi:hypothetical protein